MSVRVQFLNLPQIRQEIRARARECLKSRPEVLRVILFGSVARGDAIPGSDADILILVQNSMAPTLLRALPYLPFFEKMELAAEIHVYSLSECALDIPLLRTALAEGQILAERLP